MSADHSSKAVPSHQDNGVAYTDAGNFDLTTVYIAFQRQGNGVAYTDAGNFDSTNCFTTCMTLLMATSAFWLKRRC